LWVAGVPDVICLSERKLPVFSEKWLVYACLRDRFIVILVLDTRIS